MIAPSAVVYDGVRFGSDPDIGEFVVIGSSPHDWVGGELETSIGPNALIRSHTVIYAGNTIGARFQTGHGALIREMNSIGNDVSIGSHSVVEHHVKIADGVRIHSNAFIPEFSELGDECWIGPNAVLTNARYPLSRTAKDSLQGPKIGARAVIGANATILPGVIIGDGALVGAGSVVTHNVATGLVVAGNPARVLSEVTSLNVYD